MPFEQNQAVIRQFTEAFNKGDLSIIDDLIDRDFYHHVPEAGEQSAPEVLNQLTGDLVVAFPDLRIDVENFTDHGDTISFDMTLSGTLSNGLWGAPSTNKHASWTSRITCRFSDGKFAFCWSDFSVPEVLGALRQIGMVPPPDKMDQPPKYPISIPEILLKALFTGQVGDKECSHLEMIRITEPTTDVCEQCVEMGDVWPGLRMCLVCGFAGCCDTSKNKHMKQHYEETGHPIFRSIRLQESWVWCYEDDALFQGKILERYG